MSADTANTPSVPETTTTTTTEDVVIPEYLHKLLETIATREGFADGYTIISRSGSNVGDGFQGIMLSVVISGTRNGNPNDDLVLICKIPPLSELRRKMAVGAFKQEIAGYESYLPALVKFQQESGISEADGFFAFPKCYGTFADEDKLEFALVLEDLRHNGFRMWNKYLPIDYKHVELALTQLGKFHALSFALRSQQPELFKQFQDLNSGMFKSVKDFPGSKVFFEKNFDQAIEALHPEDDKEAITKLTDLRNNCMSILGRAVSSADAEPFTVFCHGDCWNNNMMFQYDSADSLEPKRVILIDWQLSQYCSPVTDLTYYLYSSTEQSLRAAHFDDFLHVYHDSLAELLQRLGGNASKQISFDDLDNQLKGFGVYGLIMAPILIQVVTVKAENLPDMDSMTEDDLQDFDFMGKGKPDAFNKRIRDVVRDFLARGYLGDHYFKAKETEGNSG